MIQQMSEHLPYELSWWVTKGVQMVFGYVHHFTFGLQIFNYDIYIYTLLRNADGTATKKSD